CARIRACELVRVACGARAASFQKAQTVLMCRGRYTGLTAPLESGQTESSMARNLLVVATDSRNGRLEADEPIGPRTECHGCAIRFRTEERSATQAARMDRGVRGRVCRADVARLVGTARKRSR